MPPPVANNCTARYTMERCFLCGCAMRPKQRGTLQVLSACFLATVSPRVFMPTNLNCRVLEPSLVFTAPVVPALQSCRGLPLVLGQSPPDWPSLIIGALPLLRTLCPKHLLFLPPRSHHPLLLFLSIVAYGCDINFKQPVFAHKTTCRFMKSDVSF